MKQVDFYVKKKHQQFSDKSTASHDVDELGENHPIWEINKPPEFNWINIVVLPACIWVAIALVSAKFNISQGDFKPHTWLTLDFYTAFLIMFWSAIAGAYVFERDFKYWFIKWALWWSCIVVFVSSIMYVIMFVINLLNK